MAKRILTDGDIHGFKYQIDHSDNLFKLAQHHLILNIKTANDHEWYGDARRGSYEQGNANVWEWILVMMGHTVRREGDMFRGVYQVTHIYIDDKLVWKNLLKNQQ